MNDKIITKIILENLLTPIIYKYDDEYETNFICFCDRNVIMSDLHKLETKLETLLNKRVTVLDVREIPETERIDIINKGTLIYYEDELIKNIFEHSMVADFYKALKTKKEILERNKICGTIHLA